MRISSWIICGLLAAIATAGPASAKSLNVVASFTVLADVVKEVGGSDVVVTSLVGANGDPHEFEPSPDDAKLLKAADIAFLSGEGLEAWFEKLARASGYDRPVVVVSQGIKTLEMESAGRRLVDPHVWNSPLNVAIWVGNIAAALTRSDPEDAEVFTANAARYVETLKALDAYAHSKIDSVPPDRRKILTSHEAFAYFGNAYGVQLLAPVGLSTETEASAFDVAKLIDQIRRENFKMYFFENSNDRRLVDQISKATGAVSGGELFVEALSPPDGPASTYAKMFRYNVDQIAKAMIGT